MKSKNKEVQGRPGKCSISILLYVVATLVALLGIAILVDDIFIFKSTIDQYVMQGYPAAEVMKSLIPAQLLPGVFEALALYGGMTFALIGIGIANRKLSGCAINSKPAADTLQEELPLLEENETEEDEITNEEEQNLETEDTIVK